MNGGIINSVTRLHLVGYFYWVILRCTDPWILNLKKPRNISCFNSLNAELNPICHLLALLGAHHILHVSGLRVKGKRMQRGGVPTQIANFDYCPSRSGSGHIDRPLLVGRLRASVDMWTRRRAEQPWAMAWIRSVSMPLLLQTALGFRGTMYVHFPQALSHTCQIWGCQSGTVKDFRLGDMTPWRMEYRYQRFGWGFGPHLQGRTSYLAYLMSFLDTGFDCIVSVRQRKTIIIINCKCGGYTSSYLWISI